ncbi:hypothetical protein ACWD5F_29610 [Streptomyces sp. NPDC002499]
MRTSAKGKRFRLRGTVAAAAVLAALMSVLSIGAHPAAARPAAPTAVAGDPSANPRSGGTVRTKHFDLGDAGASAARAWVHNRNSCGDAFCTIQWTAGGYLAFGLSGCDTFDLHNFRGLFDAHNHGSLTVTFLNQWGKEIGWYTGGMHDPVNWGPVWAVRTCNR